MFPDQGRKQVADHDRYGHLITVPAEDLGDYDPDNCHYGASGQTLDLDHLMIHGQEGVRLPVSVPLLR